jgi:hypothetical protein
MYFIDFFGEICLKRNKNYNKYFPELLQMSLCKSFRYLKITDQSTENEIDSIEKNVSAQRRGNQK